MVEDLEGEGMTEMSAIPGLPRSIWSIPQVAPIIPSPPTSKINPAKWTYERLGEYIQDFEANLDSNHEIGARLVSFGQAVTFHIEDVGYYGPDIISFTGRDSDGNRVQLIQNIAQLSVLLIALPALDEKPCRIGFIWDNPEPEDDA